MLKNNILAFLLHLILALITFLLMAYYYNSTDYLLWGITLLTCLCYVAGGIFLKTFPSSLKNLLSVSVIAFIGFVLLGFSYMIVERGGLSGGIGWIFYYAYNPPFFSLFLILIEGGNLDDHIPILLLLNSLPSLFIWIGLEMKRGIFNGRT
jgi:hypothetical protein